MNAVKEVQANDPIKEAALFFVDILKPAYDDVYRLTCDANEAIKIFAKGTEEGALSLRDLLVFAEKNNQERARLKKSADLIKVKEEEYQAMKSGVCGAGIKSIDNEIKEILKKRANK